MTPENGIIVGMLVLFGVMLWKMDRSHRDNSERSERVFKDMLETVKAKSLTEKQEVETARSQDEIEIENLRQELRQPEQKAWKSASHDEDVHDEDVEFGHTGPRPIRTTDGRVLVPLFPSDLS